MKRFLIFTLLPIFSLCVVAQDETEALRKVAVWETQRTGDGVSAFKSTLVRGAIEEAVDNTQGYIKYDRAMFDAIVAEQKFQRSGAVKDSDMKKLGEMAGVQYVIVPECAIEEDFFTITVRMLDVESGRSKTAQELCSNSAPEIKKACSVLASRLFGTTPDSGTVEQSFGNVQYDQNDHNFIETAFGIDMKMIYVEGGTFTMGFTGDQGDYCAEDETPARMTTVDSYYIGMLEVTQKQWERVMGTSLSQQLEQLNRKSQHPSHEMNGVGSDYPMYYVSWVDAKEFCARLSQQSGIKYSLPTEAEWEYAARGGKHSKGYKNSGSNNINDVAWYDTGTTYNVGTRAAGTKSANELGIYDMSGNVDEWCEDWYGEHYVQYDNYNPKGPSAGKYHVVRGGSWGSNAGRCQVWCRARCFEDYLFSSSFLFTGFRVACHK